jgi:hypothetical protein
MSNFVNLEEGSDQFDLTPKAAPSQVVKKHSSRPEMFVQLRLAGPEGRMVDPSIIPIIDPSESPPVTWGAEQFMSKVILEFCTEHNSITPKIPEESTAKNDFQLHFIPALDEEEDQDQDQEEPTTTTRTAYFEQNQQGETGSTSILEELDKKELVNESDLERNKDIESIPEAPELESPHRQRSRRSNRNKKKDIIGSPTSVARHLTLDSKNTVGSPNTPLPKKSPRLSRGRSLLHQAPTSASSCPRSSCSLPDTKLEPIASTRPRRSVSPLVAETTTPEREEGNVPPTPTRRRRSDVVGVVTSLRIVATTPRSSTSTRRKVISKKAADRLGSSLPAIRSIFDDGNASS